jgi:type I restriction enzyme S subunit
MSDWMETLVKDVVLRCFSGPSPTCEERNVRSPEEWGLLKTTAVTWSGWNEFAHKVPPPSYWRNVALEIHPGDVVVTKAGPRHRVGVVTDVPATQPRLMVSGKMVGLTPKTAIVLPRVLAGVLATRGPQKYLDQRTTGMAESQVNFTNETLLNTPIRIPSMPEQRRLAEIVDTIDDAIRSTERVITKLELMKRGWLHALLTRGVGNDGELRDPTAGRDQFENSVLGRISKTFAVRVVGELLSRRPKNGHSPKEADTWTGTWMLGLGCLTTSGFAPRQLKAAPRNDPSLGPALLQDGDLLISRSNTRETVGLVGRYRDVGAPCTYPDLMMRLVPNELVSATFLELALRSHSSRRQIQAMASGTSGSMVKIGATTVMSLKVVVPGLAEQERVVAAHAQLEERITAELGCMDKLRLIKSGLMDDLLTGRVRVPADEDAA